MDKNKVKELLQRVYDYLNSLKSDADGVYEERLSPIDVVGSINFSCNHYISSLVELSKELNIELEEYQEEEYD